LTVYSLHRRGIRMNVKRFLLFLLAGLTIVVFAACTADGSAGEEPEGDGDSDTDPVAVGVAGAQALSATDGVEATALDASIGFDQVSRDPLNNLMEGLSRLSLDHTAQPGVAEDWDISEDGLTYTFHLREDANWSNGDPVVAEDFVYAWKYMLDPENASEAAFLAYFIEGGG